MPEGMHVANAGRSVGWALACLCGGGGGGVNRAVRPPSAQAAAAVGTLPWFKRLASARNSAAGSGRAI